MQKDTKQEDADKLLREVSKPMTYDNEQKNNLEVFLKMLKDVRPDIWVLMDLLDKTKINYYIIFQIIRHLNNIAMGNKYGNVTIQIENGVVTFVRGEESSRINEKLIIEPLDERDLLLTNKDKVDNV